MTSRAIAKLGAAGVDTFGVKGVRSTPTGLTFDVDVSFEDLTSIALALGKVRDWSAWAIGDLIVYGEALFGDAVYQAVDATGRAPATLLEYARVARKVAPDRRRPELAWTHHQIVAALTPAEQIEWLEHAEAQRWNVHELRGVLAGARPAALDPGAPIPDRRRGSPSGVEFLELEHDVGGAVLRAAIPLGDGYARVPMDVLVRFANARGEEWPP